MKDKLRNFIESLFEDAPKNKQTIELKEEMLVIGEKAFRSKQIYEWLHVKLADDFDEMTNLSDIKSRPDGEVLIRTGRR